MIILICGLPGTGKTSLAKSLATLIDATVLSSDKIRKELFSKPTYSRGERRLVYEVLILLAKYLHEADKNCILDATFSQERSRQDIKKKLHLSPDQICIVECKCPEEVILSRLSVRKNDYSDADVNVYKRMKKIYEPVKDNHITINTETASIDTNARFIYDNISHM